MSSEFNNHSRLRPLALLGVLVCLALSVSTVSAEENIDAAPIVISQANSTRALTAVSMRLGSPARTFQPGAKTRITVFITNIELLSGEGVTAFRADAEDGRHYRYPLQIISLAPTAERSWVYALTFKLHAGMGDVGDVLLRVNWRGMSSNRVRLAIGHEGDGLKNDEGAIPTPMPNSPPRLEQINSVGLPFTGDRARFMEQATFGANATLENQLRRTSYSIWISDQMEQKRDAGNGLRFSTFPYPNLSLQPVAVPNTCNPICQRDNYSMYPLQNWFFREALYGEDQQLRRRVSWALHQIFVVSGRETVQPSRMIPYLQILDRHAFGNFRDLLKDITLNPAMGNYLDMAISTRQNPNENYAREILQLFSIGLDMLNPNGTLMLDSQGNRIPTYDQATVNGFTKVFTGWSFCEDSAVCPNRTQGTPNFIDPMLLRPANHDQTAKQILSYPGAVSTIPAGQTGEQDFEAALDNIFYHPNVAPFVSKLLIRQFVTSNPTPAYVKRVADVFNDQPGGGIDRGNLGRVIRAILLDPEARGNNKTDPDYGHLKEPVLFVTNVLRPFAPSANTGAAANCNGLSDGVINGATIALDQDVFNPPSVFNYYSLDYTLPNTNLFAPEFAILTTGTALKRPNFIYQMFGPGTNGATGITIIQNQTITQNQIPCGTRVNLTRYQSLAQSDLTGTLLVDTLNRELMHGAMSPAVRNEILTAVQAVASNDSLRRTQTAIYLITTSSQYQVLR
ncbi:MAG: DUF1800 domain-containing protein [Acidobacteria bacterium]|nr:DUF1800 domain-containing protein [Acidobacteriota bacterium]